MKVVLSSSRRAQQASPSARSEGALLRQKWF